MLEQKGSTLKIPKEYQKKYMGCKHEFFLVDIYTLTDKIVDPKTGKITFSKKIGKVYTFACKFCLELKQATFYFSGGERFNDKTTD